MIIDRLSALAKVEVPIEDRLAIWDALRSVLSRHRSFRGERWVLPAERLAKLDALYSAFEPSDLESRCIWLFGNETELPEGYLADWEKANALLGEKRRHAVLLLRDKGGIHSIYGLVARVENPYVLARMSGLAPAFDDDENELLERHLASSNPVWRDFALGFVVGRIERHGWDWVRAKLADAGLRLTPDQRADLLFGLPCSRATWDLVESNGPETEASYWKGVRAYPKDWSDSDLTYAIHNLIQYSRPYDAVEILAHTTASSDLKARALEAVLSSQKTIAPSDHFSWQLREIFKILQIAGGFDQTRLARLEWAFLPLFDPHEFAPTALQNELARSPEFFAEVVSRVYRADDSEDKAEPTEIEQAHAQRSHHLLQSWGVVPGADASGIDAMALKDWVGKVRAATTDAGRLKPGDRAIGRMLAHSPPGTDGHWPHEAVRQVLEDCMSEDLERGIEVGLYNQRGWVQRDLTEGGERERDLANKFSGYAAALATRWPRTAAMLRRIAAGYERDATRQDNRARRRKDGLDD